MLKAIKKNLNQIFLFILIGALSAVVEICSFRLFSYPTFFPNFFSFEVDYYYPISNFALSACGIIFNYFLSIWFVFKQGKHSKKKEFTFFMVISFFSMLMTWIVSASLLMFIKTPFCFIFCISQEVFCKIIAIGIVAVFNYVIKKKFIFHE